MYTEAEPCTLNDFLIAYMKEKGLYFDEVVDGCPNAWAIRYAFTGRSLRSNQFIKQLALQLDLESSTLQKVRDIRSQWLSDK